MVLKIKPRQRWCIKCRSNYWWNDETKSAWQWWIDMRVPVIGSRYWQWTCMEIIMCMWNARMARWLGGEITWSGYHGIRTCQGHGVAYRTPITFLMVAWSISVNDLAHTHTKHMMWSGWCINEISQQSRVMYTGYVQTPSNSHSEWHSGCIGTLLAEISGFDVGDKEKHLLEDIGRLDHRE
jgi:hypothetical protein